MERNEMQGAPLSGDVNDTIAFGSMLVFASVMPPLGSDTPDPPARSKQQRAGMRNTSDPVDGIPGGQPARQCPAQC